MSLQGTFTPDNLIAGEDLITDEITLASGNLSRGAILGRILIGAASKAAKAGGNTGNGTLTLDVTTPILAKAKPGVYSLRVTRAAVAAVGVTSTAMSAIAELRDPDGFVIESVDVPTTPGVAIANQVKFVVLEGNTPFALGDGFDITLAAGSKKAVLCDKAAVDGSAKPHSILAADTDASGSEKLHAPIYLAGEFSDTAVSLASGTVVADVKDACRELNIYLKTITTR